MTPRLVPKVVIAAGIAATGFGAAILFVAIRAGGELYREAAATLGIAITLLGTMIIAAGASWSSD